LKQIINNQMRNAFEEGSNLSCEQIEEFLNSGTGPKIFSNTLLSSRTGADDVVMGRTEFNREVFRKKGIYQNEISDLGTTLGYIQLHDLVFQAMEVALGGVNKNEAFSNENMTDGDKNFCAFAFLNTIFHEGAHYGHYFPGGNKNLDVENGYRYEAKAYRIKPPGMFKSKYNGNQKVNVIGTKPTKDKGRDKKDSPKEGKTKKYGGRSGKSTSEGLKSGGNGY